VHAELKVPQGKLLRVRFNIDDSNIRDIRFTGDFFLHPEEALKDLESALEGKTADMKILEQEIVGFFERSRCTLVGIAPESFVTVIDLALKKG